MLAHCLAKKAVLSADTDVWVKSLPEDVENVFHSDFLWTCCVFFRFWFFLIIFCLPLSQKRKKKKPSSIEL